MAKRTIPILRPTFDPWKARAAPSPYVRWRGDKPLYPKQELTDTEVLTRWWEKLQAEGSIADAAPPDHPEWPEWVSGNFLANHATMSTGRLFNLTQVGSFLRDRRVPAKQRLIWLPLCVSVSDRSIT